MEDEFKDLQTLLRLKKYEQPPQGFENYSERFLKEFHRRQRWEASEPKGLAAVWESVTGWFEGFTVPRFAYATALAVFGAITLGINGLQTDAGNTVVASTAPAPAVAVSARPALALNSPLDLSDLEVQSQLNAGHSTMSRDAQPRYILDTRPASYNASFSF